MRITVACVREVPVPASEAEIELQARVIALEYVLKTCLMKLVRLNGIVIDHDNQSL